MATSFSAWHFQPRRRLTRSKLDPALPIETLNAINSEIITTKKSPEPQYECCDLCGFKYVSKQTLIHHRFEDHGLYPHADELYDCEYCEATFVYELLLARHQAKYHFNLQSLMCTNDFKQTLIYINNQAVLTTIEKYALENPKPPTPPPTPKLEELENSTDPNPSQKLTDNVAEYKILTENTSKVPNALHILPEALPTKCEIPTTDHENVSESSKLVNLAERLGLANSGASTPGSHGSSGPASVNGDVENCDSGAMVVEKAKSLLDVKMKKKKEKRKKKKRQLEESERPDTPPVKIVVRDEVSERLAGTSSGGARAGTPPKAGLSGSKQYKDQKGNYVCPHCKQTIKSSTTAKQIFKKHYKQCEKIAKMKKMSVNTDVDKKKAPEPEPTVSTKRGIFKQPLQPEPQRKVSLYAYLKKQKKETEKREEENRKQEADRQRLEEERRKIEEIQRKRDAERQRILDEQRRIAEEERLKLEEERRKVEEAARQKQAEEDRIFEEERRKAIAEEMRLDTIVIDSD